MSDDKWDKLADYDLGRIANALERIATALEPPAAEGFQVRQTGENGMPTNNSIVAGQVGTFSAVTVSAGGLLAPGAIPVWTASDPLVTLTADATGLNVAVGTSATDTAANFTLTITGINSNGVKISQDTTVTLGQGVVTGTPATGFAVTQIS